MEDEPHYDPLQELSDDGDVNQYYISYAAQKPPTYEDKSSLSAPLFNPLESISFYVTDSTIDPFSSLIKHLKHSSDNQTNNFDNFISMLSLKVPNYTLLSYLFQLIKDKPIPIRTTLVLQSMLELTINDQLVCQKLLEEYDTFFQLLQKQEYASEVLYLLESALAYGPESIRETMCIELPKIEPMYRENLPIRGQFFAVYAVLSTTPQYFTQEKIEDIIKRTNYIVSGKLIVEISKNCLICVSNFISCGDSSVAYKLVGESSRELLAKVLYTLQKAVEMDSDFILLIMKVLMEIRSTFPDSSFDESFSFSLGATLISLSASEDETVKKIAGVMKKSFLGNE